MRQDEARLLQVYSLACMKGFLMLVTVNFMLILFTLYSYSRNPHEKELFMRALRLRFNRSIPLNKNPAAETGRGSYLIGFISLELSVSYPQNFQEFLMN